MTYRPIVLTVFAVSCLALTACDALVVRSDDAPQDSAPADTTSGNETAAAPAPAPVRPAATEATAEIDWEAARADLAARPVEESRSFTVQSGAAAPPVPVLLPEDIVIPAGAESEVQFQPLSDGYFASYPGTTYDIIVNGTNEVIGAAGRTAEPEDMQFLATLSGAQVSFSRYGADYLVEFECKAAAGAAAGCITEEEAMEIAGKIAIAGTR